MRSAVQGMVFRRQLPNRRSCQEQAAIAATVIAAWQIDSQSAPVPPPPPAPLAKVVLRYELGGAVTGSIANEAIAVGGLLEALLLPGSKQIGLRIGLFGSGLRSYSFTDVRVDWTRTGLRLGGGYRFLPEASRSLSIDGFADTSVALAYTAVHDGVKDRSGFDADFAVGGGARLGRQFGPVRLYWEMSFTGWLFPGVRQRSLYPVSVPQLEALLSFGVAGLGVTQRRFVQKP